MAHFAELDSNNIVLRVVVVDNDRCGEVPSLEESRGVAHLHAVLGVERRWVQTSYNGNIRKQYAGKGDTYDETADIFIKPQPFASWSLDANYDWQAPVPQPDPLAVWNEETQRWE